MRQNMETTESSNTDTTEASNTDTTEASNTDTTDEARNIAITVVLVFLIASALILNITFISLYAITRKLRTPHNYLLVSISVADILSALLWLLPAAVSAVHWQWIFGDEFCKAQGFLRVVFYCVNILSLLAIILEKLMKFWSPSRHKLAFTKIVSLILVFSLWGFSLIFAMMPLIGWGEFAYIEPRYHCEVNFGSSDSVMQFYTVAAYVVPFLLGIIFFLMMCGRVTAANRRTSPLGEAIIEDRGDRIGETYGERLKRAEEKYRSVANNKSKPKMGQKCKGLEVGAAPEEDNSNDKGNIIMDNETDDSDWVESENEDYFMDYSDVVRKRQDDKRRKYQKRQYRLHRRDVKMAITVFLVWFIYMALWFPYLVLSYVWIYNYYPDFNDSTMHTIIMTISLASVFYKPIIYFANAYMRNAIKASIKKRLLKRRKEKEIKALDAAYERNKNNQK